MRNSPFLSKKCENDGMIILYGIAQCDSVKKARAWLSGHGLGYTFHDFKKQGVPAEQLKRWTQALGWEKLLNHRGTTWRKLDGALQAAVIDAASAEALMLAHPSVIKRPVVDWSQDFTVGFDAGDWGRRDRQV
jgi:arsenate reductase (glutaredoxin)